MHEKMGKVCDVLNIIRRRKLEYLGLLIQRKLKGCDLTAVQDKGSHSGIISAIRKSCLVDLPSLLISFYHFATAALIPSISCMDVPSYVHLVVSKRLRGHLKLLFPCFQAPQTFESLKLLLKQYILVVIFAPLYLNALQEFVREDRCQKKPNSTSPRISVVV